MFLKHARTPMFRRTREGITRTGTAMLGRSISIFQSAWLTRITKNMSVMQLCRFIVQAFPLCRTDHSMNNLPPHLPASPPSDKLSCEHTKESCDGHLPEQHCQPASAAVPPTANSSVGVAFGGDKAANCSTVGTSGQHEARADISPLQDPNHNICASSYCPQVNCNSSFVCVCLDLCLIPLIGITADESEPSTPIATSTDEGSHSVMQLCCVRSFPHVCLWRSWSNDHHR